MDNNNKDLATKLGRAFGIVIGICLMALVIAVTAKVIMWIF